MLPKWYQQESENVAKIVSKKIRNYYSPYDEVLRVADDWNWVDTPIGFKGAHGKTIPKYY